MSMMKSYEVKLSFGRFKVNVERYRSANEVVEDCKNRSITDCSFKDMSTHKVDRDWEGVRSYEEALDLLKNGYQPVVEKLEVALKINRKGDGKRISFQNNVNGFAPIVPLALKGVPNNMIDMQMKPIKCKVVDVYYDIGVSASTSTETIIENGQKLLAAIIELEKQGYRFNLYAMQSYNDGISSDVLCVKVKDSGRPLDLKRISFPLTHPAFFRVIGFDWYSKFPLGKYRCGYGCPLTSEIISKQDLADFTKEVFGENAIYISSNSIKREGVEHIKEVLTNNDKKQVG